jgi:HEPN domain-containing protein
MNRQELQAIAILRIEEAQHLLSGKHYSGAYYLAGYAVECGLKACLAKNTREYDFPGKKLVNESHTHDLPKLLRLADLEGKLTQDANITPELGINWNIVKAWSEESRYWPSCTKQRAQELQDAITDKSAGLFQWLERHW